VNQSSSTEAVRNSIRRTQHEMSETIHEIERRLSPSEKAKEIKEKARETRDSIKEKARERTLSMAESVRRAGGKVMDTMEKSRNAARDKARSARSFMHEQPLTLALLALAAGAALGALIPETQKQDELLGDKRDHLVDRATNLAHDRITHAKQVVKEDMRDIAHRAVE